jgi:DNA primase
LVALVRSRGVELTKYGAKDFAGRCPFHEENEASFIVSPGKGLYHCMGCGVAGNAIQFVEKFDGVSFRHAYELLAEGKPAFSAPAGTARKGTTIPRLAPPFNPDASDAELLRQVVDYYHERLLATEAALAYLKGRGLYDEEAVTRFRLGFADRTLGLRLPEKNRLRGAAQRTLLSRRGIMRDSGHEHFSGSLLLPVFTENGEVGEMYGRKITQGLRKGTPLHLYLPGPHRGIWNPEALDEPEVILWFEPGSGSMLRGKVRTEALPDKA